MGVKGSAAIRARQREVAARVERLIAQTDARTPLDSGRQAGIRSAIRIGRAALRKRERVLAELDAANAEVGAALNRIVEADLTHREAFEALGLSIGVGRRLLQRQGHAHRWRTARSSTTSPVELVDRVPAPEPEANATCGDTTCGTERGTD